MERPGSDLHRPLAAARQQRHTMGRLRKDLSYAGVGECRHHANEQEISWFWAIRHHDRPGERRGRPVGAAHR